MTYILVTSTITEWSATEWSAAEWSATEWHASYSNNRMVSSCPAQGCLEEKFALGNNNTGRNSTEF